MASTRTSSAAVLLARAGAKPPSSPTAVESFLPLRNLLEGVEDFGAHAQAFGKGLGAAGDDHEFLDIDGGVGVGAAVDDVHHGDGQGVGIEAAEVAVQRDFEGVGGGAGDGHGDAEHGVGAELGLGFGAVELEQGGIDGGLVAGIHAGERLGDGAVDVLDGLEGAFAEIALGVAVAQFEGFVDAGGGAGGDGGAAEHAAGKDDIGFEGGIAAGVEDFAGADGYDLEHGILLSVGLKFWDRPGVRASGAYSTRRRGNGNHFRIQKSGIRIQKGKRKRERFHWQA
jgi:hypothetical protein